MEQIERLERYVAVLFIATGALYTLAAVNTGLVFVNEGYDYQAVSGPLLLLGLFASILGLLGIYSAARDDAPRLAKATGGAAGLALAAVLVLLAWGLVERYGGGPETPAPLAIVALVLFISSFSLAGATVLRSPVYTRPVGYLLLGEAVALALVVVVPMVVFQGTAPEEYTIGIELTQAVLLLVAGSFIRGSTGTGRQDATTGAREA